jgi:energy-coupling factor transporter ATP-binding protein EcfA2
MLRELALEFGPDGCGSKLTFDPRHITVFVGPNGSGKSQVLLELYQHTRPDLNPEHKIVNHILIDYPDENSARLLLDARKIPVDDPTVEGNIYLSKIGLNLGDHTVIVNETRLLEMLAEGRRRQEAGEEPLQWSKWHSKFLDLFTIRITGQARIELVQQPQAGNLQGPPLTHLDFLFRDDAARTRVREITADVFDLHFVIDPTKPGQFRVRMADRAPNDAQEEQAIDHRARAFHGQAKPISELSDGVKAFTGIVSALMSSDFRNILVDEPEAFLHPTLARRLGNHMATLAEERDASVFAATHSAEYVMGCVESGKKVNIVRLTYERGNATARLLSSHTLTKLMRDPLLRATNVLSALFYSGAVIGEGDVDRAFYQEINMRLLSAGDTGVKNSIFLNSHGKQTMRRIVKPLRAMGIPAAAIVDIDIIKNSALRDLLNTCYVPPTLVQSITTLRGKLEQSFNLSGRNMKEGGITLLSRDDQQACRWFFAQLRDYGVFVVPNGEVESWLSGLGVQVNKQDWLPAIFERMGADPADPAYIKPGQDDVWEFMRSVAKWVHDPQRLGIPTSSLSG